MKIKPFLYKKEARIEILPLIDIVFLLLIFFIYSMLSMAIHKGVDISLSDSDSAKLVKNDATCVTITENNLLYIEKTKVSYEELKTALLKKIKKENDPKVLLFADKAVECQEIFSVLDKIKAAGVKSVSLQAKSSGR